ncbi:MAG: hypothetical protein CMD15_03105 [Flavobacteriales bacterium]|nr:hypothetical protein [Flavobacteriales bacterium]|tara:strand:- start:41140 stop:42543 length:1404 start_codon:yes stop_codon:yes gene_type:complete
MEKIKQFFNFKNMSKKKKLILFGSLSAIIAIALVFTLTGSSSDGMKVIPKNTVGVAIIDLGALYKKADIDELRELDLVQDAIKLLENNIDDDKIIDIINDPNECGIDVKSELYIFSSLDMNRQFVCASIGMDDIKKFEDIIDEYKKEVGIDEIEENNDEKYNYVILDDEVGFAWDKEVLLLVSKVNDDESSIDFDMPRPEEPRYPSSPSLSYDERTVDRYDDYDDYIYRVYYEDFDEEEFYEIKRAIERKQNAYENEIDNYEKEMMNYDAKVDEYWKAREKALSKPLIKEIERLMTLDSDEKITKNSSFKDFYSNKTDVCLWASTDFAEDMIPEAMLSMGLKQINKELKNKKIDNELSADDIYDNSVQLFFDFGDGDISLKTGVYINKNVRDLIEEITGIDPKELSLELILTFDNSGANSLNAILMSVYNIANKIGEEMMKDIFEEAVEEFSYNNHQNNKEIKFIEN